MQPVKKIRQEVLDQINADQQLQHSLAEQLLANIKANVTTIGALSRSFETAESEFIYRFYHQSFKIFGYQHLIFTTLSPQSKLLNSWFRSIVDIGLAKEFTDSTNENWLIETQPLLDAFWHSRFFANQMLSSTNSLDAAPRELLPYDWAAVLYLYDLR